MAGLIVAADQLAARVRGAGVRCYVDPALAAVNRPCVLVAPPSINYVQRRNDWRLVLLAAQPIGSLAALAELDELLAAIVGQTDVPIEAAEPASYALTPETGALPAYLLRTTT